jgi:hypothetical protein
MMRDEWDKLAIRMTKEGIVKQEWLVHESGSNPGFCCFDMGDPPNLVWITDTIVQKEAIEIVNQKRLEILKMGLWNDKKVREVFK